MEHVILATGYPRKTYIANKLQIYGMCPAAVLPLHVAMTRDHGNFVCHSIDHIFSVRRIPVLKFHEFRGFDRFVKFKPSKN